MQSAVERARDQVLNAAAALLAGELSVLTAARKISAARHELDPDQTDSNLLAFAGIDSELDTPAVVDSIRGWHPSVREAKERESAEAQAFYRPEALRRAAILLTTYARPA
jgi:hypothetical protein